MATPANPYEQASALMQGAANTHQGMAGNNLLTNINSYIDPYYQQVMDAAIGRTTDAYNNQMTQLGDQAQMAGAFGGGRHGVTEGVLGGQYQKNVGDLAANISSNAYQTGFQNAATDQSMQMQQAAQMAGLGNQYFNTGQQLMQNQYDAGSQQQALMNAILQGGAQQYQGYMQAPYQIIDMFSALLHGDPRQNAGQTTQTSTPGLFDYLSLGAGTAATIYG